MFVRKLKEEDIGAVMEVQEEAYMPVLLEPPSVFRRKMSLFPEGAAGCFDHDLLAGYLFCHPWTAGLPAPFSAEDLALPEGPDAMYVHDLAVRPSFRGRGVAGLLWDEALEQARERSLSTISLVAVQGSQIFWEKHGFEKLSELEYRPGVSAVLMRRPLDHS